MRAGFLLSAIILYAVLVTSCKTTEPAASPEPEKIYRTFEGRVKIVEIVPLNESDGVAGSSYLSVYFDFLADDASAIDRYAYPELTDRRRLLEYDNRNSFHKNWIAKWNIKTGNEYRAVRIESGGISTGAHVFYEVELAPGR